ncbi:MAG: tetratricopeptide repeat protein [Candidatus Odinarchaeota archaeon]
MPVSRPDIPELQRVEYLLNDGNSVEAIEAVHAFITSEKTGDTEKVAGTIFESEIYSRIGDLVKALQCAEKGLIESQKINNPLYKTDAFIAIAEVYNGLGNYTEALTALKAGEQAFNAAIEQGFQSKAIIQRKAWLLYHEGRIHRHKDRSGQFLTCLEQSRAHFESIDDQQGIAYVNSMFIDYYCLFTDEYDVALNYSEKVREAFRKLGNRHEIAWSVFKTGWSYYYKKDAESSLKYLEESCQLFEQMSNKLGLALNYYWIGGVYHIYLRRMEKALRSYQQSLLYAEELNNIDMMNWILRLMGAIYRDKGEIDKALELFHKSFYIDKKLDQKHRMATGLRDMGYLYHYKRLVKALDYMERSKALYDELGDVNGVVRTLWHLVIFAIDLGSDTDRYLTDLEQIASKSGKRNWKQIYQAAKGMKLVSSPRIVDKARAQLLFKEILEERDIDSRIAHAVAVHLIDVLISEFKAYGAGEAFNEAKLLLERLDPVKQQDGMIQDPFDIDASIDVLVLKSKFVLLDGDFLLADSYLDQAETLAKKNGLDLLTEQVTRERMELEEQLEHWQKLIEDNAPFITRLEKARISEYISQVKKIAGTERASALDEDLFLE